MRYDVDGRLLVSVDSGTGTGTGPSGSGLTDAQLRATPVQVAGPLTDSQLRASAVAVAVAGVVQTVTQVSRGVASATIATATSVSGVIDCQQTVLVGLVMPAAWTSAALTVEVSADNAVWAPLVDATGAAVSIASPSLNTAYSLDLATMIPWRYVRLRSGTTAAPVAQGADRAVTVLTRPLA